MANKNIKLKSLDGSNYLFPQTKAGNVLDDTGAVIGQEHLINKVETVKVDGTALTPDTNKAVNIDLSGKQNKLTAGTNIAIDSATDTISATDTTYTAGNGLTLTGTEFAVDIVTTVTGTSDVKVASEKAVKTYVDNKVASTFRYKGSVATTADLPTSGQEVGDVYNVETADPSFSPKPVKAGDNVCWTGTVWDVLSGTVDLSGYVQKTDIVNNLTSTDTDKPLSAKQGKELQDNKLDKSKLTINGDNTYASNISIKAPTAFGTAGQVLKTNSTADGFEWGAGNVIVDNITIEDDTTVGLKVKDGGVSADKLATDSVVTAKIKDSNVTTAKIADSAITNDKINSALKSTSIAVSASATDDKLTTEKAVRTALDGKISGVQANGTDLTPDSNFKVNIPAASDSAFGVVKVDNSTIKVNGTTNAIEVPTMVGASSTVTGSAGIVPAPATGDQNKFLCGDSSWKVVGDITYEEV